MNLTALKSSIFFRTRKFANNDTAAHRTSGGKFRCMDLNKYNKKIVLSTCLGLLTELWTVKMDPSMRKHPTGSQLYFSIVLSSNTTLCVTYKPVVNRLEISTCSTPPTIDQLMFIDVDHFALIKELQGLQNFRVSNMLFSTLMSLCPKTGSNTCPAG